jgi:hypothetical protein
MRTRGVRAVILLALLSSLGCASTPTSWKEWQALPGQWIEQLRSETPPPAPAPPTVEERPLCIQDAAIYEKADEARTKFYEREAERYRADLEEAEASIVAIESGLRGELSRADAVSAVAEARIAVDRSADAAPWRAEQIREAREKVEEADRQLREGRIGSAIFFASRARRVSQDLLEESSLVASSRNVRFVIGRRVNLRDGPSTETPVLTVLLRGEPVFSERAEDSWQLIRTPAGRVGWVHRSLLRRVSPLPANAE